jgi:hypothetical protein
MTDSVHEQQWAARREPTPDEAYRLTYNVGTDEELARLRSEVKPPNLLGSPSPGARATHRGPADGTPVQRGQTALLRPVVVRVDPAAGDCRIQPAASRLDNLLRAARIRARHHHRPVRLPDLDLAGQAPHLLHHLVTQPRQSGCGHWPVARAKPGEL